MKTTAAQHTPGPWVALPHSNPKMGFSVYAPDPSTYVSSGEMMVVADYITDTNARLISTAPDGYALAQHILALETDPYLQGHPEWEAFLNEAQALVKKAGGQ